MKNTLPLLLLLLNAQLLFAQQSVIRGEASIINSKYENGKREYVPNAQIEEEFDRATPQTTDAIGRFDLVVKGVKEKETITFSIKKEGLEVVNTDALSAVAGQRDLVKVYMATRHKIDEYKKQYYNIGKTGAEKALEAKNKSLQAERQTLLADKNANKERIAALETELGLLEAQRSKIDETARELARRYAPINLDDTSPLYQEAFSWFQKGELEKALDILQKANLAGQAQSILNERSKISAMQLEVMLRDSVEKQRTRDVLSALDLQADLHQTRFEWDSAMFYFEVMLELDSTDYNNTFRFAYFLQKQNQLNRAIALYEKCLSLSKTSVDRGATLNNLGGLYTDFNRMAEAEKALQEALENCRLLSEKNPGDYLPDLAGAYGNLARLYQKLNQYDKAETYIIEAVKIGRNLAGVYHPLLGLYNNYYPQLAFSLHNLGVLYSQTGKMQESENALNEALTIRRQLADKNPDAFLPVVAGSLSGLGVLFFNNKRMQESEKALNEALTIRRQLADKNPDAFLPDVAATQISLGNYYTENQKMPEAGKAYNEALSHYRLLANKNPDVFLSYTATVLYNLGGYYRAIQNINESEKALNEALSIFRQLADKNPDAFLSEVAATLNSQGVNYYITLRMPEAEKAYSEALGIRRQFAEKNPGAFLSKVAWTLNALAKYYQYSQKIPEAEKAFNEALSIYRQMAEKSPGTLLPDLASTLNDLGELYRSIKNYPKALDYYEEALHIQQADFLLGRTRFVKDYVQLFHNISGVKDSTQSKQMYPLTVRAVHMVAASCDSLRGVNQNFVNLGVRGYIEVSWWAVFAKDYTLSVQAGLRSLDFDPTQIIAYTNIGHAKWLSGHQADAQTAWLHLKGRKDINGKDYKQVLEEDWQAFEKANVVPPGAFDAARKWLAGAW